MPDRRKVETISRAGQEQIAKVLHWIGEKTSNDGGLSKSDCELFTLGLKVLYLQGCIDGINGTRKAVKL